MTSAAAQHLPGLIELIREVKPTLVNVEITPAQSLSEDLGLDSLDIVQLARKARRELSPDFAVDAWIEGNKATHWTVGSLIADLSLQAA